MGYLFIHKTKYKLKIYRNTIFASVYSILPLSHRKEVNYRMAKRDDRKNNAQNKAQNRTQNAQQNNQNNINNQNNQNNQNNLNNIKNDR